MSKWGLECKSRKSRNTWSNRQIWPWNTEWSRAKANRVLPRERTGHSRHPLPTTQGNYNNGKYSFPPITLHPRSDRSPKRKIIIRHKFYLTFRVADILPDKSGIYTQHSTLFIAQIPLCTETMVNLKMTPASPCGSSWLQSFISVSSLRWSWLHRDQSGRFL